MNYKESVINTRISVLKAMDDAIRNMNDESAVETWLMVGVPDEASDEDYEDIASDHDEYVSIVSLFGRLAKRYAKEDF